MTARSIRDSLPDDLAPSASRRIRWILGALLTALVASGCSHVEWVSPYSADLQKRATDMLSEVVAWERHMYNVAGTAASDPRSPEVQAKLESWRGEIETMSEIELSIDPGATACDKFIASLAGGIPPALAKALPTAPDIASSAVTPVTHCETLPDIFTKMMTQVSETIPEVLNDQCKLPWLDEHFAALQEGRPAAGASSAVGTPSTAERELAVLRCRSLFEPPKGTLHGDLMAPLILDLDAIIYREGRQAPHASQ
jgi:hypothetical protein